MAEQSAAREGAKVVGFWLVLVVLLALVAGLVWALRVATSGVRGQGDAVIEKNSAENWTAAQARFEDLYAEIDVTVAKIQTARAAAEANPTDVTAQQTHTGLISYCLSVVGDYNAAARSYLSEDFRAADLPAQISTSTCQE